MVRQISWYIITKKSMQPKSKKWRHIYVCILIKKKIQYNYWCCSPSWNTIKLSMMNFCLVGQGVQKILASVGLLLFSETCCRMLHEKYAVWRFPKICIGDVSSTSNKDHPFKDTNSDAGKYNRLIAASLMETLFIGHYIHAVCWEEQVRVHIYLDHLPKTIPFTTPTIISKTTN